MKKQNYRPLVSIIIPVYNAEEFIKDCINSVVNQTYTKIEIILVDDGSTDNSLNYVREGYKNDFRFKFFTKKNEGPSSARNFGLEKAKGEYIQFLDDDDILSKDCIEKMLSSMLQFDTDIVVGNTMCFNEKTKYLYRDLNKKIVGIPLSGCDYLCYTIMNNSFVVMLYNYFYKREFIETNKLRFDTNIIHEDELWTPIALLLAKSIVYLEDIHYYYRFHLKSIVGEQNIQQIILDTKYVSDKLLDFINSHTFNNTVNECIINRILIINSYAKSLSR